MVKKIFFSLLIIAISTAIALAQTSTKTETSAQNNSVAMEEQVRFFIKSINELPKNGSSEPLMRLFSPHFSNHVTIFDLDGKTRSEIRDFGTTQLFYNRYTLPNIKADYRLSRMLKSYSNDSIGFVVFEIEYDMYNNGSVYKTGEQTVSFQVVKANKQWVFEGGTTFIRYKQLTKAPCDCQLYSKGNSDYVATLQVPQGDDYVTRYHNLHFVSKSNNQKEVLVDGVLYVWTLEGSSFVTTPDKRSLTIKSRNEAEVINAIIGDIHKEHCFNIVFQK